MQSSTRSACMGCLSSEEDYLHPGWKITHAVGRMVIA